MRVSVLNALTGSLGLAAIVDSTPAPWAVEDCSANSIATVFVTIHTPSIALSTVYVTVPVKSTEVDSGELPVTTVTHYATISSTATESFVTPAPNGLLSYMVESDTTHWLDDQTPVPGGAYVYSTSSITVVPVYDSALDSEKHTSTLTLQSTLYATAVFTSTDTLSTVLPSSTLNAVTSAGTGLPYTVGPGGWNATIASSTGGALTDVTSVAPSKATGAVTSLAASAGFVVNGDTTLAFYSSFDIYKTHSIPFKSSSFAAESGFNAFSTSTPCTNASSTPSDLIAATSSVKGALTTGGITNKTAVWKTLTTPCIETPYIPYVNSTLTTLVRTSSHISGGVNSLSSSASGVLYSSSFVSTNSNTSATSTKASGQSSLIIGYTGSVFSLSSFTASSSTSRAPTGPASSTALSSLLGYTSSSLSANLSTADGSTTQASTRSYASRPSLSSFGYSSSLNTFSSSTALSSALGFSTSLASSKNVSSTFSIQPYGSSSPVISSKVSSVTLTTLTSLSSTTSDDCTDSTNATQSPTITSDTAAGALMSLSSSTAKLSSASSSQVYLSSSVRGSTLESTYAASTTAPVPSSSLKPSSTLTTRTSTNISSSVYVTPTDCGEHGNFVLNFDDIPPLGVPANDTTVQPEPVFNPYHQFDFSDGFTVVPAPKVPYNPSSPPLFIEFIPNFNINGNNTHAGPNTAEKGYNGQISDGDFDRTGCFHFNVYGARMGCDSTGPACDFTFAGYRLDAARNELLVATQTKAVAACPALSNCGLTEVDLDYNFVNLAFVRINVTVDGEPKIWWMDDLRLGWFDNSCDMGLCRQATHVH